MANWCIGGCWFTLASMLDQGFQWHFLHWQNRRRVSEQIYENIDLCSQVLKKHPQQKRKKGRKTSKVSYC
jgi:hypothetical protein